MVVLSSLSPDFPSNMLTRFSSRISELYSVQPFFGQLVHTSSIGLHVLCCELALALSVLDSYATVPGHVSLGSVHQAPRSSSSSIFSRIRWCFLRHPNHVDSRTSIRYRASFPALLAAICFASVLDHVTTSFCCGEWQVMTDTAI